MPDPTPQEVVEARRKLARYLTDDRCDIASPEDVRTVLALLDEAERVLEPFAKIRTSSFYAPDGSDGDVYEILVAGKARADFSGADIHNASRLLLKLKGPDHG